MRGEARGTPAAGGILALLATAALLASSCSGDEDVAPVPATPPQATRATTPNPASPVQPAAATPAVISPATPRPRSTAPPAATATAPATPVPPAAPVPSPPTAPVAGPLLVFSENQDRERAPPEWTETRRVYIYDVSTNRYWAAFDYPHAVLGNGRERSAVRVAGGSLIVWSEHEVRHVGLDGETESVLFEHEQISWLDVSPDGTAVAIMYGADPAVWRGDLAAVLVIDIATGREVLDTGKRFDPVFAGSSEELRQRWHADGTALLVAERGRAGLLRLDGTFELLPEEWNISPDLRYAVRVGGEVGAISLNRHQSRRVWDSLDVLDVETGEVLWTVRAQEGGGLYRHIVSSGDGWWGPGPRGEPAWDDRRHLFFIELASEPEWRGPRAATPSNVGVLQVLDAATGEARPLTGEIEGLLRGPIESNSESWVPVHAIRYDGRIIWEGARRWFRYLGVVARADDIELAGVVPRGVAVEPDPPAPPPRAEITGPILLYEVYRRHPTTPRLAIAHELGTGRSWALHRRSDDRCSPPQAAGGGLVACSGPALLHIAVDGQGTVLLPGVSDPDYRVAPGGGMVAVATDNDILLLSVPSGEEILRVEGEDIVRAFAASGEERHGYWVFLSHHGANGWSLDGTALLAQVDNAGYEELLPGVAVIDVTTGEIAVVDGADYPAPSPPPQRATADCPQNPGHPCRILLDGDIVGEGRWAAIIGLIELD